MRDPTRTVLAVTDLPHAWALLRDRIDPAMAAVLWARPEQLAGAVAGLETGPWVLAGDVSELPEAALEALRGRLFAVHWVGQHPPGLTFEPVRHDTWPGLATEVERLTHVLLAGLRLAPGCGLALPGGVFLGRTAPLEGLLAAHPDGLAIADGRRLGRAVRGAMAAVERHGLPVRVVREPGRIALVGG
ncbi:MAG: hypothetical protein M3024_00225 [Candidatus Dormibacteraeota bacterium]|nr:hypothetical protein [Candidatus Dormibacteraeota bacterium]